MSFAGQQFASCAVWQDGAWLSPTATPFMTLWSLVTNYLNCGITRLARHDRKPVTLQNSDETSNRVARGNSIFNLGSGGALANSC